MTFYFQSKLHGGDIVDVACLRAGKREADGVVLSKDDGVAAGVATADCAPVVIIADEKAIVLHISRKTLIRGLLNKVRKYINPAEIKYIYIGPHICERHFGFEKEGEEIREFISRYPDAVVRRGAKIYLSIRKALQIFFNKWGVSEDKIIEDGRCTYESDELPSYERRREGGRKRNLELIKTTVSAKVR